MYFCGGNIKVIPIPNIKPHITFKNEIEAFRLFSQNRQKKPNCILTYVAIPTNYPSFNNKKATTIKTIVVRYIL